MAVLTGVLGCALTAATIDAIVDLRKLYGTTAWQSARGEITSSTVGGSALPRRAWHVQNKYLSVEYEFIAPAGKFSGRSRVASDRVLPKGSNAEIKFNPEDPAESMLTQAVDDQIHSARLMLTITLPLAISILLFAWYLWRNARTHVISGT